MRTGAPDKQPALRTLAVEQRQGKCFGSSSQGAHTANPAGDNQRTDENPTIGILLCTSKNDTVVKMSLPETNTSILASQYQLYLPTKEQLKTEVETLRRLAKKS